MPDAQRAASTMAYVCVSRTAGFPGGTCQRIRYVARMRSPAPCVCDHISPPALHATTNVCYKGNDADSRGGMRKYSKVARNHCATTFQHFVSRFSQIVGTGCATRAVMIVTSQSRAHPQPWRNIVKAPPGFGHRLQLVQRAVLGKAAAGLRQGCFPQGPCGNHAFPYGFCTLPLQTSPWGAAPPSLL